MHSIRLLIVVAILAAPSGRVAVELAPVTAIDASPARDHALSEDHDHGHGGEPGAGPVPVSLTPVVKFIDADQFQQTAAHQAIQRFSDLGLPLPDIEVSFHDADEPCEGHLGLFSAPGRVRICSELMFVITHELAHAWDRNNVDDETRARFEVLTGQVPPEPDSTPTREPGITRSM